MTAGRTTDEWEALLDGTTPGPWNAGTEGIDGPGYAEVLAAETETRGFGYMAYEFPLLAGDRLDRDLPLAAAAPDAVAEVVRLRRAIEERIRRLRLPLCSHVPDGDELDELVEQWAWQDWEARTLTAILEGTYE